MNPAEKLARIRSRCVELLEIATTEPTTRTVLRTKAAK